MEKCSVASRNVWLMIMTLKVKIWFNAAHVKDSKIV